MKFSFNRTFISFTIILFMGCTEDPPNTNGEDNNDTNPTTMPQEHIPWPSLADSPWPMYRHDPQGTGRSQYPGPQLGEIKWTLPFTPGIVASEGITSFAIGPDSTIYFGSSFEKPEGSGQTWVFYAVAPGGTIKWTFRDTPTHQYMEKAPLVTADNTVIFGVPYGAEGYIYALSPDGTLRWKFHADGQPSDLNIGLDGTICFVGGNDLYALTPDGQLKWRLLASSEFSVSAPGGLAISPDGQTLYVCGDIGYQTLYAVGIDGAIKWSFFSGDSTVKMYYTPMVDNQGNIYISPSKHWSAPTDTNATGFFSLTPQGEVRWKYGIHGVGDSYTIDENGNIYFVVPFLRESDNTWIQKIVALDYAGQERWKRDPPAYINTPLICDTDGTVYTVGWSVVAVSGYDGATIWQLPLPWHPFQTPAIGADGTLYLGFSGGEGNKYVYAIH